MYVLFSNLFSIGIELLPVSGSAAKSTNNMSVISSASNQEGKAAHVQEAPNPVGEAVHEDRTLKDASEITWLHSPSQDELIMLGHKRQHSCDSDSDADNLPQTNVSMIPSKLDLLLTDCQQ
jgi:hypothetical protein